MHESETLNRLVGDPLPFPQRGSTRRSAAYLRSAAPGDLQDVIRRVIALGALEAAYGSLPWDPAAIAAGVRATLEHPARCGSYLLAVRDGASVGQLLVRSEFNTERNGIIWWIDNVFVDDDHRRHGVFSLAIQQLVRAAHHQGNVLGLRLHTNLANTKAQLPYFKNGFVHSGSVVMQRWL